MRVTIETERLILRNLRPGDEKAVYAWAGDPDVARYMIYPQYRSESDGIEWLCEREENADDPDDYDLGIVLKETGELIGSGGLVYQPDSDTWNMGYNIRKDMWGKGYVAEAMQAIIDEVRMTGRLRVLEAQFALENQKSRRVMEKLGMVYDRESSFEKFDKSAKFQAKTFRREFE